MTFETALRVLRAVPGLMISFYDWVGLTNLITRTNRYQQFRPTDALLLNFFIYAALALACVFLFIALVGGMTFFMLVVTLIVLAALPPLFTIALLEVMRAAMKLTSPGK